MSTASLERKRLMMETVVKSWTMGDKVLIKYIIVSHRFIEIDWKEPFSITEPVSSSVGWNQSVCRKAGTVQPLAKSEPASRTVGWNRSTALYAGTGVDLDQSSSRLIGNSQSHDRSKPANFSVGCNKSTAQWVGTSQPSHPFDLLVANLLPPVS